MHRSVHSLFVVIIGLLATVVQATQPGEAAIQAEARQTLQDSFPGAQVRAVGDLVLSVYGRGMDTGEMRLPLCEMADANRKTLEQLLADY